MSLMLVDIATVYYRAFFGLPDSFTSPDGRVINAVRGSFDTLLHFINEYEPEHLITAWDLDWRPQWRVDLVETYKTARVAAEDEEQMPDNLSEQVDLLRSALSELGVPCVGVEDFEADDIVAHYARTSDRTTWVVSGDRDLFQLVDDDRDVSVLYLGTGVTNHTRANGSYISERFGIHSSQYGEFSVLRGDASDGLPGVKGVGEKTAAALLNTFGDIDGIMQAARNEHPDIKPRIRGLLLDHEDYVQRARQIVLLNREVEVPSLSADWRQKRSSQTLEELGLGRYETAWHQQLD